VTVSSRQERRKQRTTDAILDAAEALFFERGYAAGTIDAIAEAADVAIGSIYARFAGKEGLYLALVERLVTVNEAYIDDALSTEGTPLERVLAAGDAYLRFHRDHPLAFRLVGLRDLERSDDETRRRIARRLKGMLDAIASALAEAVAAGETAPLDPYATATFLWGAWNGSLALHARGLLGERGLRETLDAGTALLARGLAG
jgi:AcrR family transcriptional regulator